MDKFLRYFGVFAFACLFVSCCLGGLVVFALGSGSSKYDTSCEFVPGDATGDGNVSLLDALRILNYVYRDGDAPEACAQVVEGMTKEEYIAARNQFEPRGVDHFYSGLVRPLTTDNEEVVVEVPEGKVFVVTYYVKQAQVQLEPYLSPGVWSDGSSNGNNHPPLFVLREDLVATLNTDGNDFVEVWGYFLDASDKD